MADKLDEIVDINITRDTPVASADSFEIEMHMATEKVYTDRTRKYNSLTGLEADGYTPDTDTYKSVQTLFSQIPAPSEVLIGRRDSEELKVTLTEIAIQNSFTYRMTIAGVEFTVLSEADATSDTDAAVEDILTLFATQLAASAPVTDNATVTAPVGSSGAAAFILLTEIATKDLTYKGPETGLVYTQQALENIVTAYSLITASDNGFFFVTTASRVIQEILDLAARVETEKKMFFLSDDASDQKLSGTARSTVSLDFTGTVDHVILTGAQFSVTSDPTTVYQLTAPLTLTGGSGTAVATAIVDGYKPAVIGSVEVQVVPDGDVTTVTNPAAAVTADDIGGYLAQFNYDNTSASFSGTSSETFLEDGWIGTKSTTSPGTSNWMFANVKGVISDELSFSEAGNLHTKNINTYEPIGGRDMMRTGTVASGEFVDNVRGTYDLEFRMQIAVFDLLSKTANSGSKVGLSDLGVESLVAVVEAELVKAQNRGFIKLSLRDSEGNAAPAYSISIGSVADLTEAEKAVRQAPDITFEAALEGAVNKAIINGVLSV